MRTFAMGVLYAVPSTANPTPVPVASLKECSVDVKQTKKQFRGPYRGVVDVADAALDIAIKVKTADFRAAAFNLVVPGVTFAAGSNQVALGESATIPAVTFQVTVINGATFAEDGGVLSLVSGKWMTRVASAPTTGQYSVNTTTGVYTFASADVGLQVIIAYAYNSTTIGQSGIYTNQFQSQSTPFKLRVYEPFGVNGQVRNNGFEFFSVHFEKITLSFKIEDWAETALEGFATQDMIGFTQQIFKPIYGE